MLCGSVIHDVIKRLWDTSFKWRGVVRGAASNSSAVVQAVAQIRINLDHFVELGDQVSLECLVSVARDVQHGDFALSLDVQLGTVGAQVGIADRGWNGEHVAGTD